MSGIIIVSDGDETSQYKTQECEHDGVSVIRDPIDRGWTVDASGDEIGRIFCEDETLDDAPHEIHINQLDYVNGDPKVERPTEITLSSMQMEYLFLMLTAFYDEKSPDTNIQRFKRWERL